MLWGMDHNRREQKWELTKDIPLSTLVKVGVLRGTCRRKRKDRFWKWEQQNLLLCSMGENIRKSQSTNCKIAVLGVGRKSASCSCQTLPPCLWEPVKEAPCHPQVFEGNYYAPPQVSSLSKQLKYFQYDLNEVVQTPVT